MSSGKSMDTMTLMQKLVDNDINTSLLIEFYEEVVENEKVFCRMVEDISRPDDISERKRSVDHIERFCVMLRNLQDEYDFVLGKEKIFITDMAKRETMIDNASRFIDLLETDRTLQSPHDVK